MYVSFGLVCIRIAVLVVAVMSGCGGDVALTLDHRHVPLTQPNYQPLAMPARVTKHRNIGEGGRRRGRVQPHRTSSTQSLSTTVPPFEALLLLSRLYAYPNFLTPSSFSCCRSFSSSPNASVDDT
jgi:hypothetical protein